MTAVLVKQNRGLTTRTTEPELTGGLRNGGRSELESPTDAKRHLEFSRTELLPRHCPTFRRSRYCLWKHISMVSILICFAFSKRKPSCVFN